VIFAVLHKYLKDHLGFNNGPSSLSATTMKASHVLIAAIAAASKVYGTSQCSELELINGS